MGLLSVQLFFIIFLVFAVSRVVLGYRNQTISLKSLLFWIGLWILAIIGILNPQFTTSLAKVFGIGRGADIVIYFSITLLFYLLFRTQVMLEDVRHEITRVVREYALREESKHFEITPDKTVAEPEQKPPFTRKKRLPSK